MTTPVVQVVLTGASLAQRQHLAQDLQQVLQDLGLSPELHTPLSPADLLACPPEAAHVLWRSPEAQAWRAQLHTLNRPYQVVQGLGLEALQQCLYALLPPAMASNWARQPLPVRWQGVCETCGDAGCEQRLFSRLLQG